MKSTKIHIQTKQTDRENNENSLEFYAEGQWQWKGDVLYVIYKETEVSGMAGATTTVKIYGDKVSLIRFGDYAMKFDFQADTISRSLYKTPHINMEMLIDTKDIHIELGDEEASVYLKYLLTIDGQQEFINELSMKFKL